MSATIVQKPCGKCGKTVYPTEEIKCLDKYWHKGCFKCTTCGMTLGVKNVKGYEKMPYCNVHYPQPKPTVITDNPEMQRIKQLTDIQSNVKYHEDFNRMKGKFTSVTDDPAITQAKKHQQVVSQAEYTGKRKDSIGSGLNGPPSTSTSNNDMRQAYRQPQAQQQQQQQSNGGVPGVIGFRTNIVPSSGTTSHSSSSDHSVGRVADYDPLNDDRGSLARGYEPTSLRQGLHATKFESSNTSNNKNLSSALASSNPLHMVMPTSSNSHSSTSTTSHHYSSNETTAAAENGNARHIPSSSTSQTSTPYSYTATANNNKQQQQQFRHSPEQEQQEEEEQEESGQQQHFVSSHGDGLRSQLKVRALYNYSAQDADEISFEEGDTIVECEAIDAGWMLGRHVKSNKQGLLPSNYVEVLN